LLSAKLLDHGQSASIGIKIDTKGMKSIDKTVEVYSNDTSSPRTTLRVIGKVDPEFNLAYNSIDYGNIIYGSEVTKEIPISQATNRGSYVIKAICSDQNLALTLKQRPNSKTVVLIAKMRAHGNRGYRFGTITLQTSSKYVPELKMFYKAKVI
jgi:hypothetical protein